MFNSGITYSQTFSSMKNIHIFRSKMAYCQTFITTTTMYYQAFNTNKTSSQTFNLQLPFSRKILHFPLVLVWFVSTHARPRRLFNLV